MLTKLTGVNRMDWNQEFVFLFDLSEIKSVYQMTTNGMETQVCRMIDKTGASYYIAISLELLLTKANRIENGHFDRSNL
jgi:hypothetical protein